MMGWRRPGRSPGPDRPTCRCGPMRGLWRGARRAVRGERGSASIEFVIVVPVFMAIMANGIETSVMMTRLVLLERGLDLAVRDLRLSTASPPGFEEFRGMVCDRAGLIADCREALQIELRPISTSTWNVPEDTPRCIDRREEIEPIEEGEPNPDYYRTGRPSDLMMVRACLVVDPIVPNAGLGALLPKDPSGGYRLIAVSAFVQEPEGSQGGG